MSALGNRKNAIFQTLLREDGVVPYLGSARLFDDLADRGVAAAVVSSSRNAREVLQAARLGARFDVVIDGVVAAERGIAGIVGPRRTDDPPRLTLPSPAITASAGRLCRGCHAVTR